MKKKINQTLLNEELKKFRLLSEYSFYTEEPKEDDNLIFGAELAEVDDEPNSTDTTQPDGSELSADPNLPPDTNNPPANGAPSVDPNMPPADNIPPADNMPVAEPEMPPVDDMSDDVEVDVTQLVQGSEDAKKSADIASLKTSKLLKKFSELERRISAIDLISNKIENLEKEIIKRTPTPTEKLEMRSLDSYPYNIKLTDFFGEKDTYDAVNNSNEPKEYVLKKDDIDTDYIDSSIKNSFNIPDDFEEEEID
jgi:hypothetical protein